MEVEKYKNKLSPAQAEYLKGIEERYNEFRFTYQSFRSDFLARAFSVMLLTGFLLVGLYKLIIDNTDTIYEIISAILFFTIPTFIYFRSGFKQKKRMRELVLDMRKDFREMYSHMSVGIVDVMFLATLGRHVKMVEPADDDAFLIKHGEYSTEAPEVISLNELRWYADEYYNPSPIKWLSSECAEIFASPIEGDGISRSA